MYKTKKLFKGDMVTHGYDFTIWEVEAGGLLRASANLSYKL